MLRLLQKRVTQNVVAQCTRMMSTEKTSEIELPELEDQLAGTRRLPERGMNKVTLVGRVGRDPEQRGSDDHPAVVFPLATNLSFRKANGEVNTRTDWHRICVFLPSLRNTASSRISRGDRVLVEGSIAYQKFTDADKKEVNVTSILANNILILSRRQNHDKDGEN